MDPYIVDNSEQLNNPARLEELESLGIDDEYYRVLELIHTRERNVDREMKIDGEI